MLSAWILIASRCNHSISSFLRVPMIAAVGLASTISAIIFPSLIARVPPSLLVGLAARLPCGLLLLLLALDERLLAAEVSFLISCEAADIDQQWDVRI